MMRSASPQRHRQRVAQPVKLTADVAAQRVEDGLAVEPLDEAVEDAPAVHTEDVGDHPADACAAAVHHLADTVTHPAALPDQGPTIAAERAQLAQLAGGHEARRAQAKLTHPRQPAAVLNVRLAPAQLLDLLCMEQLHLDPGLRQRVPGCLPVHARGLHRRGLDPMGAQPRRQRRQTARKRVEAARLAHRLAGVDAQPHGRRDLHLVNVQPCRAGVDNV